VQVEMNRRKNRLHKKQVNQELSQMQSDVHLNLIHKDDPNTLCVTPNNRIAYYTIKRILDVVAASILLILLAPLMMIIAAVIYIYSPGPVLFVQKRVGARRFTYKGYSYWKRCYFDCYKFRTMKIDADPSVHQEFVKALIENDETKMEALQGAPTQPRKLVNDSRILAPGRLLRKLSLDELPQFWNVLIGDMSLVGPRPAIPYEVEMYKPWHLQRLQAQPGLSGLQQVTARSIADFDRQVQLDIDYIENQSIWLDLKIIIKTPLAVFSTSGAY
jgi:lipopolysaccharide/colanic/teichoic acid biosynthesis glycosyltransferase